MVLQWGIIGVKMECGDAEGMGNMARIDRVVIHHVETKRGDAEDTFDVSANWQVEAVGGSFHGPFYMGVYDGDSEIGSKEVTAGNTATISSLALTPDKSYEVRVKAVLSGESCVESQGMPVLLEEYEGVRAVWDGKSMVLTWNPVSGKIGTGMIRITGSQEVIRLVDRFDRSISFSLDQVLSDRRKEINITITAKALGAESYGPPIRNIICLVIQPWIKYLGNVEPKIGVQAEASFTIRALPSYDYPGEIYETYTPGIVMVLESMYGERVESEPVVLQKANEELAFHFSETEWVTPRLLGRCSVGLKLRNGTFSNESQMSGIPAGAVAFVEETFKDGTFYHSFLYEGAGEPHCFCIIDGNKEIFQTETVYAYDLEEGKEGNILKILPVFGSSRGRGYERKRSGLPDGFYVDNDGKNSYLSFWEAGTAAGAVASHTLSLRFQDELFVSPWTEERETALQSPPFSLKRDGLVYVLEVQQMEAVRQEQLTAYLVLLEENDIRGDRIPELKDMLARTMRLPLDEICSYAYGLSAADYCCDVIEGMRLLVEWENYQHQQQSDREDCGFYGTNLSEYQVSASWDPSGKYILRFDHFLRYLNQITFETPDGMTGGSSCSGFRGSIGGVIDFFHQDFAFPYYRLVFPQTYRDSTVGGTLFEGEHVMLFGTRTQKVMKESMDLLAKEYVALDKVPAAISYFHGRTLVCPQIAVFINGKEEYIPIGTTVRDIMQTARIPEQEIDRFRFRRRRGRNRTAALGAAATDLFPIYLRKKEDKKELVQLALIQGDVIEYDVI